MSRVAMTQAVAADYADAMLVARRAKRILGFFLWLILIIQLAIFFTARYVPAVRFHADVTSANSESKSTNVVVLTHQAGDSGTGRELYAPIFEHVIDATDVLGVVLGIVLPVILLLIIFVMLVGRLVGVAHMTSAFCWSIVFLVVLFPWQALWNNNALPGQAWHAAAAQAAAVDSTATTRPSEADPQFFPEIRGFGALYTFDELRRHFDFPDSQIAAAVYGWGRFVALPVVELFILMMVLGKSRRGLRFALGESEVPVDLGPVANT